MKKFSILIMAICALALTSCDDDDQIFTVTEGQGVELINSVSSVYTLTFDTKDNLAERFVWTSDDFGVPTAVSYELQADVAGGDFSAPQSLGSTSSNELGVTVEMMNNVAGALGLAPFQQANIDVRVVSSINADNTVASAPITLSVIPYTTESPKLWVPGNYAASSGYGADWTPDDPNTPFIQAVEFGSTDYEGYVFMNVASPEFKLTLEQDWDEAYGDAGNGMLSLSGGNLTAPGPGYYKINVNTDPNGDGDTSDATINIAPTSWGIIGPGSHSADWGFDADLTYDQNLRVWAIEGAMAADEFKFRSNDDWGLNYGMDDDGDGSLNENGGNFSQSAAGNYRVELDLSNPRQYTMSVTSI